MTSQPDGAHCCHYHYAQTVGGAPKTGPCGGPPLMSTDFPGQSFGRGDTITIIAPPADPTMPRATVPGWEGSIGPFPAQYGDPHVYARDVNSGAGSCVCGRHLGSTLHVQAAPGVPIPVILRAVATGLPIKRGREREDGPVHHEGDGCSDHV